MIPDYKVKDGGELPLCQHGECPDLKRNPFRACLACPREDSCRYFQWAFEERYKACYQYQQTQ